MDIRTVIKRRWKKRSPDSHKGDYGRVFIIAGSLNFSGAPHLAAQGALRAGAGLVTLAVPESIYTAAASREAEVMVRPFSSTAKGSFSFSAEKALLEFMESQDVVALGPGLGQEPQTQKLVRNLIKKGRRPLVLDADALNALNGHLPFLEHVRERAVITPHPGEFQRLFQTAAEAVSTEKERKLRAREISRQYGIVTVLKGNKTVVASPGEELYVNKSGNPGMASGGTGDVLTGIIAALAGQGFTLGESARFGVFFHGLAGDLAAREKGETGMTASDIIRLLPAALKSVLRR